MSPKNPLFYFFRHYATYRKRQKNFEKKSLIFWFFFEKLCCLQLWKKWFSSLMRIVGGIMWHNKIFEILTRVYFCKCKNITVLNLERGADSVCFVLQLRVRKATAAVAVHYFFFFYRIIVKSQWTPLCANT